ncbi:hypothetical protein N7492_009784 [Penicillium capsulatum]|uniref:TM2 domain-containing protein n=1 Tax=Penicillium capsulatum TaxID=69766 RepID=A0A9W9HS39_9EURO|nr:hypothetical protein N7492_009784 [Penicillium capsulatum]
MIFFGVAVFVAIQPIVPPAESDEHHNEHYIHARWRDSDNKCDRQERTATLLAIFLGTLGVDQWYAHHWALAVFKLLTGGGFGIWSLVDIILWVVGGVYDTPGCSIG